MYKYKKYKYLREIVESRFREKPYRDISLGEDARKQHATCDQEHNIPFGV